MASPYDDYENQVIALMKSDVGRKVWISKREGIGLPFCSKPDTKTSCPRISNISLTIKSAITSPHNPNILAKQYFVETGDGRTGFVRYISRDQFIDGEASLALKEAVALCEAAGPRIGMSKEVLLYCWGQPAQTNVTTTSNGSLEQLVYGYRGYVYLMDGMVSAVQTSR